MPIEPIDLREINAKAANVYEAVIVAAKKARKLNDEAKLEFNTLVSSLVGITDDELDDRVNPDLLRISIEFEKREKPHLKAMKDLINGDLEYRYRDDI